MVEQNPPTEPNLPESIFDDHQPDPVVQDIFADVAPVPTVARAPATVSSQNTALHDTALPSFAAPTSPTKKILLWGGLGLGLVVLTGFVAFMLVRTFSATPAEQPAVAPTNQQVVSPQPVSPPVVEPAPTPTPTPEPAPAPIPTTPVLTPPPPDADADGLTDVEEGQLGTRVDVVDSDNDGLSDREEVRVYATNPLDADTDRDGFLDGEEVRGRYNPKGPGKLLITPTEAGELPK